MEEEILSLEDEYEAQAEQDFWNDILTD